MKEIKHLKEKCWCAEDMRMCICEKCEAHGLSYQHFKPISQPELCLKYLIESYYKLT